VQEQIGVAHHCALVVAHGDDGTVMQTRCCYVTAPRPQWALPVYHQFAHSFFLEKSMDPKQDQTSRGSPSKDIHVVTLLFVFAAASINYF
jgi:hypothetical protein